MIFQNPTYTMWRSSQIDIFPARQLLNNTWNFVEPTLSISIMSEAIYLRFSTNGRPGQEEMGYICAL
jgi:hypothetical protein